MDLFKVFLIGGAIALLIGVILMNIPFEVGSRKGKIIRKLDFTLIFLGAIFVAVALLVHGALS